MSKEAMDWLCRGRWCYQLFGSTHANGLLPTNAVPYSNISLRGSASKVSMRRDVHVVGSIQSKQVASGSVSILDHLHKVKSQNTIVALVSMLSDCNAARTIVRSIRATVPCATVPYASEQKLIWPVRSFMRGALGSSTGVKRSRKVVSTTCTGHDPKSPIIQVISPWEGLI